jgi:AbrB family looped-hinge helix DNA binding protein
MDRKIDWLGRVTIPKEVRKQLHLNDNDMLTLEVQGDSIVLSKKAKTPLDMRRITKFVIDDNRKKKIAELKAKYQPGDRVRCL